MTAFLFFPCLPWMIYLKRTSLASLDSLQRITKKLDSGWLFLTLLHSSSPPWHFQLVNASSSYKLEREGISYRNVNCCIFIYNLPIKLFFTNRNIFIFHSYSRGRITILVFLITFVQKVTNRGAIGKKLQVAEWFRGKGFTFIVSVVKPSWLKIFLIVLKTASLNRHVSAISLSRWCWFTYYFVYLSQVSTFFWSRFVLIN